MGNKIIGQRFLFCLFLETNAQFAQQVILGLVGQVIITSFNHRTGAIELNQFLLLQRMLLSGQLTAPESQEATVVNDFVEVAHLYHVIIIVNKLETK